MCRYFYRTVSQPKPLFRHVPHPEHLSKNIVLLPALSCYIRIPHYRFLSKKQLQNLAAMPHIDVLRGELCSILQSPARKTVSLLGSNQQALSMNLEQYVKDQQGDRQDVNKNTEQ